MLFFYVFLILSNYLELYRAENKILDARIKEKLKGGEFYPFSIIRSTRNESHRIFQREGTRPSLEHESRKIHRGRAPKKTCTRTGQSESSPFQSDFIRRDLIPERRLAVRDIPVQLVE